MPATTKRRSGRTGARISSSPRSEPMRHRILAVVLAGALVAVAAMPASAANKEHQQLMADIRMLQEQSQLLQNMLASLTDVVKTLSTHLDQRLDQQNAALVKGLDRKSTRLNSSHGYISYAVFCLKKKKKKSK